MSFSEWSNKKKKEREEEEKKSSQSSSSSTTNDKEEKPSSFTEWSNKKHGGKKGWEQYLADQSSSKQQETEEESFWDKLGRWLGPTGATDTTLPMGNTAQITHQIREDTSYTKPSDDWSDEQRYEFGALYLESPEKAYAYAEKTNNANNKAKEEAEIKKVQDSATSNGWAGAAHTVGAIASAGLGLADYLNMLVLSNAGRDPLESDGVVSPFEYSTAVTEGIATDLNEKGGTLNEDIPIIGGKGWGDVYSLGTSIAQSAVSGYTLGPAGTLVSYFGQGAASGMKDALNRGASEGQAALYGASLGTFEAVAEMIGIDNLFKLGSSSTIKGLIKNILNQALAEGAEEGLTSTFSNIADALIMQDKSNFNAMLNAYMEAGMSETEAKWAVFWDSLEGIAYDTIAGAASGGIHGGLQTGIQTGKYSSYVKNAYGGQTQDIVNDALNSPHSSVQEIGQKYQEKLDSGKSLSGWNLYELLETTDSNKIKDATLKRLGELGETSDVTAVAEVLVKQAMGQELSYKDQNILNNSKYGNLVSTELVHENILSDGLFDKWSENIGTRMVSPEVYNKGKNVVAEDFPNKLVTKGVPKESKYKSSESGKTTLKDQEVSIQGIESIKGGEVTVRLENGDVVNASDIEFGSQHEALMYDIVARMDATPETANSILSTIKPTSTAQASMYYTSVPLAYEYGKINHEAGLKNINLPKSVKNAIFTRGRIDAMIQAEKNMPKTDSAQKGSVKTNKKGIIFEGGYKYHEASASPLQKSSMEVIEAINAISNLEVHIYESKLKNGKRVAYVDGKAVYANGYFKDGNKIYIDINAGQHGEGLMLDTLGHEVTHYIRENDAKGFKAIADFLIEQYGKKGENVEALLESQRKKIRDRYARENVALPSDAKLNDMAYEELVADAMSEMFNDPKAVEKLSKLKQENRNAWETLRDAIKNILDKIKSILDQYKSEKRKVAKDAVAVEAARVRDFSADAYEKLQDLYIKAFVEADANYAAAERTLSDNGIMVNPSTESATIYSVRDVLDDDQRQNVAKALATRFGVTQKEALQWLTAETSLASLILNPKYSQYLDYTPDPNEVAIKTNSDYPQGTVDFSPICAKRREFTAVMNNILRVFKNHVFAATDLAKIRSIMQEEGMTIPCGICYVEDRRQLDTIVAQNFIDSLKLYREGSKTRPDGKAFNTNQLKGLKLTDGDSYTPTIYELVSLEGLNVLKEKNPSMAEAWIKFNNARGMQSVRLLANEAEYKRQILKYGKQTVKAKNDKGGLRIYSFSDAEMFHLIDIIQVITDSATVGLSLQGYTKVNEYARAVKDTGEKLNRSLIPKGELGYHIENGEVVLDYDTVEGIDINHPDFFDNRDNPNVGNITIGVSDTQIRAAMVSDFVDQIIPFHTGQSEDVLGEKGISTWSNYKDFQTEKDIATGKVSDHQINIYTEVLQPLEEEGKPITKRTFVEKFLQVCKENNLTPRFSQFLNTNEKGEFVYTEGYHKMLVDFKTFAQTEVGEYLPQMPVKPIFDNEYITKILKDYVKSQKVKDAELAKSMPKVIERITNEIVKPSETKFSDRDSDYLDAVNRNDMVAAQKMVDEAAREAGYTVKAYHGTKKFGFTQIDPSLSDDKISFFATDSKETVSTYSVTKEVKRLSDASNPISDEEREAIQAEIDLLTFDLIDYCNSTLGVRGWLSDDYFDKILDETYQSLEYGTEAYEAVEDISEKFDDVYSEFLYEYHTINYTENPYLGDHEKLDIDSFEVSEEADKLADDFHSISGPIINKLKSLATDSKMGIYDLYANTDNHLVVECHNSMWNNIDNITLPDITSEEYKKYGYTGHRVSWTTRSVAAYAKDLGYSGVTFKNIKDSGDGSRVTPATVYVFFSPQTQVKSADPVTYDDNGKVIPLSERFNPQNNDIRYSDREIQPITEEEYQTLEKHFGVTGNFRVAGYLLPNGKLLDFSGKHWGDTTSRSRQVDHRDVNEVLDRGNNGFSSMVDMIGSGNIRLMPETGGINLAVYPNEKQRRVLSAYINYMLATEGQVIVDYDAVGGDTVYSRVYEKYASSRQILSDIRNYFNGARQSDLMQFHTMYSDRVTDEETLDFLENQEHVTVYRAMQVIDGKLYPPMNAYTKDETGKKVLMPPSEIGEWEQAVERPDLIDPKTGKFKLDKGKVDDGKRGTIIPAAYNPYIHTSASPLNDQFSSAYKRSNLVVVEGKIPVSELTSGYRAEFAKDTVGETKWHSGPVAGQLKGDKARRVFLSRWFKPVRIVPDSEVASIVAKTLEGENIDVPYNVVTPSLRTELEKVGVSIKYSERDNIGYHAGDLGKAEYYFSQGYYRGTGHFGTGTYFVGDEEKISGSGEYGRRPHHAVDFSNYNLYKITSDKDGWELHEQLRVIDGGISQEWITAAQNDQFSLVGMTDVYDLAEERFGEDKYSDEAMESAILELAEKHGIELLSREEYSEKNNIPLDDEDFSFYYVLDYLRTTFEAESKNLNSNYGEFRDAYFHLWLRFGKSNTNRALQKTLMHQKDVDPDNNRTPFNEKQRKADSLSTVFMKALGYEGIDVRGTRLDNVEYGSVIYDLKEDTVLYQDRDTDTISNRTILANALETVAKTDKEKEKLKQYKTKIALIESEQARLTKIRAEIKKLSFAKGPRDATRISSLQETASQIENQINKYDRQLLNLESTEALKGVLQREKQMAYKKAKEEGRESLKRQKEKDAETVRTLLTQHRESRQKATEGRNKTAVKAKIKKVVHDLNKLLLNPTKDQHVPIGLQRVVAEALDAINMDSMNAGERVAYYNDLISKSSNADEIAILTKKRDFFEYHDANFKERITELKNAYAEFKESDDPLIRNAHNDAIADLIKNTADEVGNKSLKDMSLSQLERVYDMYKAILATVRNSNKLFKEGIQETVTENSDAVKLEVRSVGGHKDRVLKMTKFLKKFGWDMLKPVTALKVIGSTTFERLFNNVRAAEDTWAVDVNEAKQFFEDIAAKYGYNKWDLKKYYTFKDSAGTNISITLEQIMSLYAYSKRNQADKHLEDGGFVFDDAIEVIEKNKLGIPLKYEVNDANPYRLRKEHLLDITDALTKEQKDFVDAMQTYLSDVMGAKGNEVSLAMYDIKLYKEQNYFPLKTSRYFREFDPEKSATPKIKNSGFSKKTVPQAGNPIVLSNFMDVWAGHVNDMSMYHAFVLPLEDFMRVYNYSSTIGGYDSVQQYIKNAYGSQANQYIEKLMDDLNGGARVDSSAGIINKGLSLFKKASVFASASVVVQQPSAMARALAYINPKYFATATPSALNVGKHKALWAEVKKYAPVAVIKEMGYFDTGVGRSTVEWIKGNQTFKDKMDDVLSKAPAIADELCWTHIWEAIKRETQATSNLKVNSEEFLERCGKRFTEVITNTQVYDSVLSRSGMMRSKDTGMKMATAFMAEPTTTVNMMVDGIIQGKRGNKRFTAKTVGAISASIILNSILVALVYAARDDDEDETYLEKYIGSLTSELLDGFNPLTYIPFVKDIWSIAQGYDVERSDMSVVSNLWSSIEGLFNENTSGLDKVTNAAGAIASLFGLPLKNILRDAKGMYNLTQTILSDTPTTSAGIGETIEDAFKSSIPLWDRLHESDSKADRLYKAILSGDQAHIDRVKATFKDQSAIDSALKSALRANDSRIHDAAQARLDGNISEYTRIAREIIAEGHFSQDIVVAAINSEMNAIKKGESTQTESTDTKDEATSIYRADDINIAFDNGDTSLALSIIDELVEMKMANGMDEKKAKSSIRSSMTSYWKPLYKQAYASGNTAEMQRIKQILYKSGLYGSASEVIKDVNSWLKN